MSTITTCPVCGKSGDSNGYWNPGSYCYCRICQNCPSWRRDVTGAKACLHMDSPHYQTYTANDDTCERFGKSHSAGQIRLELRRREKLAQDVTP